MMDIDFFPPYAHLSLGFFPQFLHRVFIAQVDSNWCDKFHKVDERRNRSLREPYCDIVALSSGSRAPKLSRRLILSLVEMDVVARCIRANLNVFAASGTFFVMVL